MATKYRKCFYDGGLRSLFSNFDKATDFINHIPEVVSGEHTVHMYKAYYCPKCLAWHVRPTIPLYEFKYPNNDDSYKSAVAEYKKKCKPVYVEQESVEEKVIAKKDVEVMPTKHVDKVFLECRTMLGKFIDNLDESFNNEYNDKSAKWIRECCNYIDRYIIHSKEKNDVDELSNAYAMRDVLYEKSTDMLYMLFSKIEELYDSNNVQDAYTLHIDIVDAIKNMDKKMNIDVDMYDMFGELLDMNAERFKHYNKTGDMIIKESRHLKKAREYTQDSECYANNKDWCTAYEYLQKAREEITTLVEYDMKIYYDECIQLVDRLIVVEKQIEDIFNK